MLKTSAHKQEVEISRQYFIKKLQNVSYATEKESSEIMNVLNAMSEEEKEYVLEEDIEL